MAGGRNNSGPTSTRIAIVGMACRYPDARSPVELWENVLAQRRAFRRIPSERLRLEDYRSADKGRPDCTYVEQAAVIEGYEFDRSRFGISGSTYRSTDLTHWLALDIAADAFEDAGLTTGDGLLNESTGVIIGNTLTGEFSRAQLMRLRWPYVRRIVDASLRDEGWASEQRRQFVTRLEQRYKSPFAPVGEDTLAGGLANTIAGRICNFFDLHGGGYTVDGACSSSLLAMTNACDALTSGRLDIALAGGVDLSLDPFELVGFAKTLALSDGEMRVYDRHADGFLPGEGCGMVVLMREDDAVDRKHRIYAVIRGCGISSDGSGGLTRPTESGQLTGLRRAYQQAGFPISSVSYFEGHGTGTKVGDETELRALGAALQESAPTAPEEKGTGTTPSTLPAIGTIKANIGHTKAAAGVAGLIKAVMAAANRTIPPTTGCFYPHDELTSPNAQLRVTHTAEPWPADRPVRCGLSSMGFGGINTHIVIEAGAGEEAPASLAAPVVTSPPNDIELFLFDEPDHASLLSQVERVQRIAANLAWCELGDLAAAMQRDLHTGAIRAAVLASRPAMLADNLALLCEWLADSETKRTDSRRNVFLGTVSSEQPPRIGLLFPGQASPVYSNGGALACRCDFIRDFYSDLGLTAVPDPKSTRDAQCAIVASARAGLYMLERFGITADIAVGHSVGELVALHWAGAFDGETLQTLAGIRGRLMDERSQPGGKMASIAGDPQQVAALMADKSVAIAAMNSPEQTVISGPDAVVQQVVARAKENGLQATALPVTHAFHSPAMAGVVAPFSKVLKGQRFDSVRHNVVSTVTGAALSTDCNIAELLTKQLTSPVRFMEAIKAADDGIDLWIEIGPGNICRQLCAVNCETPAIALDVGGDSLEGPLKAIAAVFAIGAPVRHESLFADRFMRPFNIEWKPSFFTNPCELAPVSEDGWAYDTGSDTRANTGPLHGGPAVPIDVDVTGLPALELVRSLVARYLELPAETIRDDSHLLSDLHMNSITVGQLAAEAAGHLGIAPLRAPTEVASATVARLARTLEELARIGPGATDKEKDRRVPQGLDTWIRPFTIKWLSTPRSVRERDAETANWQVVSPDGHHLGTALTRRFAECRAGSGVVVCLPEGIDDAIAVLITGIREVRRFKEDAAFVVVHHGIGVAGFAKTMHLESGRDVCVIEVPPAPPEAADWVITEALSARGCTEVRYEADGTRYEPRLKCLDLDAYDATVPVTGDDVVLVTGGGKGIASECALAVARQTGARLVLIGRSQPESDTELSANLARMTAIGIRVGYYSADVTDADAVRSAVERAECDIGAITAVIHGAGTNVPHLIDELDAAACRQTLAPKITGLENVLAAVTAARLRLLVTFSSIIGRIGLPGEADYALANEELTRLTERFQTRYPDCRCLALEWSVWSGVGMGERLGRIEILEAEGVTAISPDQGIAIFLQLIGCSLPDVAVVVAGRFNKPPTVQFDEADYAPKRFLQRTPVYYPGIELIADAELSVASDPYLADHVYHNQRLFPAVLGLEAMSQAAMVLWDSDEQPCIKEVAFNRAVIVPPEGGRTIRLCALRRTPHVVEVALRSDETGYQFDHFRATFHMRDTDRISSGQALDNTNCCHVPLDPDSDLYGDIMFQSGCFRRLRHYQVLRATECQAEINHADGVSWFSADHSPDLNLGDPGMRDAAIHAIQACIPHARILPIAVERITPGALGNGLGVTIAARERHRDGEEFVYDLDIFDQNGQIIEQWSGLRLRNVGPMPRTSPWPTALLSPYLERRIGDLHPSADVSLAVINSTDDDRELRSQRGIREAVGTPVAVHRRTDGKPVLDSVPGYVSASHANGVTLAVFTKSETGCDVEAVRERTLKTWRELLGADRGQLVDHVVQASGENHNTAATRVWTVIECLKKAGLPTTAAVRFNSHDDEGGVIFDGLSFQIATIAVDVKTANHPLVFSVLVHTKPEDATVQVGFTYRHRVGVEETNLLGNVYYTHFIEWQWRCLEGFLRDRAPDVLRNIGTAFPMTTMRCDCNYYDELTTIDEVELLMYVDLVGPGCLNLIFEYSRVTDGNHKIVAEGTRQVAFITADDSRTVPTSLINAFVAVGTGPGRQRDAVADTIRGVRSESLRSPQAEADTPGPGEDRARSDRRYYSHIHIVSFEETNATGGVSREPLIAWQGRCREMFLREYVPETLEQIGAGLSLTTARCQCEFFGDVNAFDQVEVRMFLGGLGPSHLELVFEYFRQTDENSDLVARGSQQILCTLADGTHAVPETLRLALEAYQ